MIATALLLVAVGSVPCTPAPLPGMIARRATFGAVLAPTPDTVAAAIAAGEVARLAAYRYLALDLPPFLIAPPSAEARSRAEGCGFVFHWPFARSRDGTSRLPTHVLPHEIGHDLFIRYLVPRSGMDEYGGAAPDWLDEMAAIACEDAEGIAGRRREAGRHARDGALIPLARLLTMAHPEWRPRAIRDAPRTRGSALPRSIETPAYYATVSALFDFLVARTGDERVIVTLAGRVRAGRPLDPDYIRRLVRRSGGADPGSLDDAIAASAMRTDANGARPVSVHHDASLFSLASP